MSDPLTLKCPTCGALPNNQCARIDGSLLPSPHQRRKELSLGFIIPGRAEASRQAVRRASWFDLSQRALG
jgi:hypothetical protein